MKSFFFGVLAVGFVFCIASLCQAESFLFDFDSGIDDNFTVVSDGPWTLDMDGPTLRISKPSDDESLDTNPSAGGVHSNFLLEGDFTITVDFNLINFPQTGHSSKYNLAAISVYGEDVQFQFYRIHASPNNKVTAWFYSSSENERVGHFDSQAYNGEFQIIRSGSIVTARLSGQTIGSYPSFTTEPVQLDLLAIQSHGPNSEYRASTEMDVSFDNLYVEADSITPQILESDIDEDGIIDSEDNCPEIYNPEQMDSDENGIGDACDLGYLHQKIQSLESQLADLVQQFSTHTHGYDRVKAAKPALIKDYTDPPE